MVTTGKPKMTRNINGQTMIAVPDGIGVGNMFDAEWDAEKGILTMYLLRSTRHAPTVIVNGQEPQRDQGTGKRPEIVVEDGAAERST
jgi:hypothetical protein